jgi:CubicO group peptidase (beta-lactamase class C family)
MLLAGVVIQRVSGQSYYAYLAEHVYKPAGMTRTGSEPEDTAVEGRAVGYCRTALAGYPIRTPSLIAEPQPAAATPPSATS